ncbi:MAG TPA: DUF4870 domain-containing protein [Aquimonas sp.]|nr:DUF4870 domain-containing protein [Xanthomonadales bacterium]HRD72589.1 DUF4870 domain-containing protein [Aquimonas sp.]HRF55398.1 DUF4870 domain-containing protein [Aquimonas sp.]
MSETPEQPLPPPPSPVAPPPPSDNGLPSSEQRQWAMFAHLSALIGLIVPFGNVLGPLVIWLVQKDKMAFVDDQGKEALNFQITVFGAAVISFFLMFILIGFLLIFVVGLGALVLTIIAAIKANEGVAYRYPLTIRLIK